MDWIPWALLAVSVALNVALGLLLLRSIDWHLATMSKVPPKPTTRYKPPTVSEN
jgi:hypothetical protein